MYKYIVLGVLGLVIAASAQPFLEEDDDFLGIPGLETLSNGWFIRQSDSTEMGFHFPIDADILKLSSTDYRLIVLDGYGPHFTVMPIPQNYDLSLCSAIRSGEAPDTCAYAVSTCLMQSGAYFNPSTDRVAVAFQYGAAIGIYTFNPATGEFALERIFRNEAITKPVGIFWAFDQFFISDEVTQSVHRTDNYGTTVSNYGAEGDPWTVRYYWIGDISGYVDATGTAQMYVTDGTISRIDHLMATSGSPDIVLHSQAGRSVQDTTGFHLHESAVMPGLGPVAFDRYKGRFYLYESLGSLATAQRMATDWPSELSVPIHIWEADGRLIVASLDSVEIGWALRSFSIEGSTKDDPEPLPMDNWTTAISPIVIFDSIHVALGTELTIDPDVEILFDQCGAIVVDSGGMLIINGENGHPVTFDAKDAGETWGGIYVRGELDMDYTELYHCGTFCVNVVSPPQVVPPVTIDHSLFDGSAISSESGAALRVHNSPNKVISVTNSTITNVADGSGLDLFNAYVSFDGVTVEDCDNTNSFIMQVTGAFRNCNFTGRSSKYGVLFTGAGTTPNYQCCMFTDLSPLSGTYQASLWAVSGTAPTFGYEGVGGSVSNTTDDSCAVLLKMFGRGVKPVIDNVNGNGPGGKNNWYQRKSGGKFLNWSSPYPNPLKAYVATGQYWNMGGDESPDLNYFYPNGFDYFTYIPYQATAWALCEGQGGVRQTPERGAHDDQLDDPPTEYDSLFMRGLSEEADENFTLAQTLFHTVATNASDRVLRWQAATHVVSTQRHLDPANGEVWIPDLIENLSVADSTEPSGAIYGERLLASYRKDRREFEDATAILLQLLSSGLTGDDSILVAIELVGVQMASGSDGTINGLDADNRVPESLRITPPDDGALLIRRLLDELNSSDPVAGTETPIPTRYALYQNYPNPFNPITEIRFDLPERADVELKIFNILGREVTTLARGSLDAGEHTVRFDAGTLASGVYIYSLEAGTFRAQRKMLLLK